MNPPEDYFAVLCKGCFEAQLHIPVSQLRETIGSETLIHFARNWYCLDCYFQVIMLIESAPNLLPEPHP